MSRWEKNKESVPCSPTWPTSPSARNLDPTAPPSALNDWATFLTVSPTFSATAVRSEII